MPCSPSFRRPLLAAAIALAHLPLVAFAQPYDLAPAPLANTLTRIASEAGLALSIDPALTQGRTAQPVKGDYSPEAALRAALSGSGLQLVRTPSGTFSLEALDASSLALPDVNVEGRSSQQDGSAEAGYRTEAVKNVGALGGMALKDAPYSISVVPRELLQNIQATSMDQVFKLNPATQFTSPVMPATPAP